MRVFIKGVWFVLLLSLFCYTPSPALAGDVGKVVVLPFKSISEEDISFISKSVPRLLSSRLSENSGLEVVLEEEKNPISAMKKNGADYALAGTITKLGKSYSLDLILFNPKGEKTGGFYISADDINRIIGGLDELSRKVAKSLAGNVGEPSKVSVPSQVEVSAAPHPPGPGLMAESPKESTPPVETGGDKESPVREVKEIKLVGELGKLPEEILRVASGDIDGDGKYEIAFMGRHRIYIYRFDNGNILPLATIDKGKASHLINIDTFDVDGDGEEDFVVTDLTYSIPSSFVVGNVEGRIKIKIDDLRGYLAVFEDYGGKKTLVVQETGTESPYSDRAYVARLEGKKIKKGEAIKIPTNEERVMGIVGMNAFYHEGKQRFILIDQYEKLRVSNSDGFIFWKSSEYYSGAIDFFDSSELDIGFMEKKRYYLAGRLKLVPSGDKVAFIAREAPKPILSGFRSFSWSRVVLLEWDGDGFVRKMEGKKVNKLISDCSLIETKEGKLFIVGPAVLKQRNIVKGGATKIYLFELVKG